MPRDHVATFIDVGAILVAILIGATTRTYFDVFVRTLLLCLVALPFLLHVLGLQEHFTEALVRDTDSIARTLGRFTALLIPASIAWGVARWWRRGRQIREEARRQLVLHEKLRNGPHTP